MMSEMLLFCTSMLKAIADFLMAPPIIYIVGMILMVFCIKAIKIIIS